MFPDVPELYPVTGDEVGLLPVTRIGPAGCDGPGSDSRLEDSTYKYVMLTANPLSLDSFGRLAMPRPAQFRPLPLPRAWPRRVRSAVIQVISLARTSLALTQGWASESMNPGLRQQAKDRLRQEIQLLREEIRIKAARMEQIEDE